MLIERVSWLTKSSQLQRDVLDLWLECGSSIKRGCPLFLGTNRISLALPYLRARRDLVVTCFPAGLHVAALQMLLLYV